MDLEYGLPSFHFPPNSECKGKKTGHSELKEPQTLILMSQFRSNAEKVVTIANKDLPKDIYQKQVI